MLFVVTTINYADRATLSMAAPFMGRDLAIDEVGMGYAFSAFGWSYAALQIPGGWLLDRLGARRVYGAGLFFLVAVHLPPGRHRFFCRRHRPDHALLPAFPDGDR